MSSRLAGPAGESIGGEQGQIQPELDVAGARLVDELGRELFDAAAELDDAVGGDASATVGRGSASRFDRFVERRAGGTMTDFASPFVVVVGQEVSEERDAAGVVTDEERPSDATVEAFLDRSDAPGVDDTQEPGIDQHLDVVRDGAPRPVGRRGEFADRHRPLEHEVAEELTERISECLHPLGRSGVGDVVEVIVAFDRFCGVRPWNVRHFPNDRDFPDDRQVAIGS